MPRRRVSLTPDLRRRSVRVLLVELLPEPVADPGADAAAGIETRARTSPTGDLS
jgi:hypothetical protein